MSFRVALAQCNPTVGDLGGNTAMIIENISRARSMGVDLLVFPECAITGYPPEDLLLRPSFIQDNMERLGQISAGTKGLRGLVVVVGFVDVADDIYNAAAVIHDGKVAGVYRKVYLPNYGVFDEDRYFGRGHELPLFVISGVKVGVNICEDIWYPDGPGTLQAEAGAEVLVNISASPYTLGKPAERARMLSTRAMDNAAIVCQLNLLGGQDELVFDGTSLVFDQAGRLLARGRSFEEDFVVLDLDLPAVFAHRLRDPRRRKEPIGLAGQRQGQDLRVPVIRVTETGTSETGTSGTDTASRSFSAGRSGPRPPLPPREEPAPPEGLGEVYAALVFGTRDYARKNGFHKVIVGMSGGMDSSLVAAIAADALGPRNVLGIILPSRFTPRTSIDDALEVARRLRIDTATIPIEGVHQASLNALSEVFRGTEPGVAEENLQARIRGNLWMAVSNKRGSLVLTGGNKSEMATGYATLYGDMAGGFAPLKDVPKTLVYRLGEYRNGLPPGPPPIPESVLSKPPSAELRPGQKDEDTLPPYDVLDPILQAYVEEDRSVGEIVAMGYSEAVVRDVVRLVNRAEHKRRQAPPGLKISRRAFGRDRRLPITNRYQG